MMRTLPLLTVLIFLSVFINNGLCIRNLFLPRTGDINISSVIAENLSNVTNFESLLGAGRALAYPFSAGMLLAIATLANEENWKVSDSGFSKVLGIPREEIVDSYGSLLDMLEKDDNVTLSNALFSFQPNFSPSEALLETLMTEVREVTWTKETWRETYRMMVEHLGNVTNEKIDRLLVPSVTKIGTPFRKTTEAVILSTFHYINTWQYPWSDAEIGNFQENPGIPYLKVEGKFLTAIEDEFTAVAVPLEGGSKSVVFVLPHPNITSKYLRKQTDGDDKDEQIDVVPFPKKWEMKQLRLKVPAFNTTDIDQYGQELEQIGMNETFCTIIRDIFGKYPYYLRPIVQVNFLDFNEDFLELASATGVAVEKFQSLFTIILEDPKTDDRLNKNTTSTESLPPASSSSSPLRNNLVQTRQDVEANSSITDSVNFVNPNEPSDNDVLTLTFDRPFLWYLNDSEVGPMFFGTVETLVNLALSENSTEEDATTMMPPADAMNTTNSGGNSDVELLSEIDKLYLWSCHSFATAEDSPIDPSLLVKTFSDELKSLNSSTTTTAPSTTGKEIGKENESVTTTPRSSLSS